MATRRERSVKKAVAGALSSSKRLPGPGARPRVTLLTPAAAKKAAKFYDDEVAGGLAAEKNGSNINAEEAANLKSGNPFKADTTSMKMDRGGRAMNAKIGAAKPHGDKRLSQTGTKIQNVARVPSNVPAKPKPKASDFSREDQIELAGKPEATLGRNHPIFTDPNWKWEKDVADKPKPSAVKPTRPSQKETKASPARRPAPSGKMIANNMSGKPNAERIVDKPKSDRGRGPSWMPTTKAEGAATGVSPLPSE
jgi:hypothetical protein